MWSQANEIGNRIRSVSRVPTEWTYAAVSVAFVALNLCTLANLAPWIDEVMLLDTAYNAAFRGVWETFAWYRVAGETPYSTYPPLYQLLVVGWMRLVGGSLLAVRSFNLLVTFLLGAVCLRLLKRCGLRLTHGRAALLGLLLWGTREMAWMYRNGRPDMLCALLSVLTLLAADSCLRDCKRSAPKRAAVVLCAALLVSAGLQAAVYLLTLGIYIIMVWKSRRRALLRLLLLVVAGFLLGTIGVSLFMYSKDRLLAFVCSVVPYSATLSRVALFVLPLAGRVLGFSATPYTDKLLQLRLDAGLCQSLGSVAHFPSFHVLAALALAACICRHKRRRRLWHDGGFLSLLFAILVPVAMSAAGRFTDYYRWMMFLPLLAAVVSAARSKLWRAVFAVAAVALSVSGVRSMFPTGDWDNAAVREFVSRQQLRRSDAVVCPFSVFYDVKPACDTCYFVGIYPAQYVRRADYIIVPAESDASYRPIAAFVEQLRRDGSVMLCATDSLARPALKILRVKNRAPRGEK